MHHVDFEIDGETIIFERSLSELDEFTIQFCEVLNDMNIKYVLVAGYVAIVFGRNRSSEDIDIIVEQLSEDRLQELHEALSSTFVCMQANSAKGILDYLDEHVAVRYHVPETPIPNMEMKFPRTNTDSWTLQHHKRLLLNGHELYISPIEMQIAYKELLGSDKDIEDARYLATIFKEHLKTKELSYWRERLGVHDG